MPPRKKVEEEVTENVEDVIAEKEKEDLIAQMELEELSGVQKIEEEEKTEDPIEALTSDEPKVMVHMRTGASYSGEKWEFTSEHPFQLLPQMQAEALIKDLPERFALATKEQVAEFYAG